MVGEITARSVDQRWVMLVVDCVDSEADEEGIEEDEE